LILFLLFGSVHKTSPLLPNDEARNEKGEPLAAETRKKVTENTRKFLEWCKIEQATKFRGLPTHWVQKLKFQRKNSPDVQKEPEFLLVDEVIQLANLPSEESALAHWRDRAMATRLFTRQRSGHIAHLRHRFRQALAQTMA